MKWISLELVHNCSQWERSNCTTPRKLVVYAPMGAQPLRSCVSLHGSRAVSYHSQQWHDVTITACVLVWICVIFSRKLFCEWNTRYALVARARWLYLAKRGEKWNCTHPRYEILINRLQFRWYSRCCTTQMANGFDLCNGTIFRIRWKIDVLFNSASPRWIEHQSFTSCEISYHCTINH